MDKFEMEVSWNPSPLLTFGLTGERNVGRLPAGDFAQTLLGVRPRFNLSSDLQLNSFIQYDNESHSMGSNTRVRWTFNPAGDVFVIYNHNIRDVADRWNFDSNQLLIKLQYAFRYQHALAVLDVCSTEDRYRPRRSTDARICPRISPPGFNGVACTLT
jgi:hypothetical protein